MAWWSVKNDRAQHCQPATRPEKIGQSADCPDLKFEPCDMSPLYIHILTPSGQLLQGYIWGIVSVWEIGPRH